MFSLVFLPDFEGNSRGELAKRCVLGETGGRDVLRKRFEETVG